MKRATDRLDPTAAKAKSHHEMPPACWKTATYGEVDEIALQAWDARVSWAERIDLGLVRFLDRLEPSWGISSS